MKKSDPFFIKGTFYFAKVHKPEENKINPDNPKLEYSVCIVPDDDKIMKKLAKLDSQMIKEFKAPKTGESKFPELVGVKHLKPKTTLEPVVIDAKKNPIPKNVLIGNGSKGNAKVFWFEYTKGKGGVSLALQGIQVTDLVEYQSGNSIDGFEETEGFTADDVSSDNDTGDDWEVSNETPW